MNSIASASVEARGKSDSYDIREEQLTLGLHLDSFIPALGETQASTDRAIGDICAQLLRVKQRVSENEWFEVISPMCRAHKAADILSEDPYTARALAKPRGFAGDAAMLDFIYSGTAPEGTSEIGRRLLKATAHSPSGLSVIDRRNRLTDAIRSAAQKDSSRARVLSIACGHLREAQALTPEERSGLAEIIALDQDALAVDLVEREQPSQTTAIKGNIRDLIAGRIKFEGLDLAYAAGLFDYLSDAVCVRLLKKMIDSLNPGGRLLVGNFAPGNWGRAYMDSFMDWRLIYRTPSDLRELSRKAAVGRSVKVEKIYTDDYENIAYLELVV